MASATYGDLLARRRDAGFEMFPVGTYDVRVVAAECETKSRKCFIVQFEVTSGPLAGRKFKNWMRIIEEHAGLVAIWFKEMAALGLTDQFFEAEPSDDQICAALMGRPAQAQVGRRVNKNSGEDVEDIRILPPVAGSAPVSAPAPNPMAAPAASPAAPLADPNAPGVPPF